MASLCCAPAYFYRAAPLLLQKWTNLWGWQSLPPFPSSSPESCSRFPALSSTVWLCTRTSLHLPASLRRARDCARPRFPFLDASRHQCSVPWTRRQPSHPSLDQRSAGPLVQTSPSGPTRLKTGKFLRWSCGRRCTGV